MSDHPTATKYVVTILDQGEIGKYTISDALEHYELTVVDVEKLDGTVELDPKEWG